MANKYRSLGLSGGRLGLSFALPTSCAASVPPYRLRRHSSLTRSCSLWKLGTQMTHTGTNFWLPW
jgi:hypothetical protein